MAGSYVLFHSEGSGSTFALTILRILDVPHEVVTLDYKSVVERKETPEITRFKDANPLMQFPTLLTPEGAVMTETAAIALYLTERHGSGSPWGPSSLTPVQRALYYRFLVYIPANIYPTVTIIEFPERYVCVPSDSPVSKEVAAQWVAEGTRERRAAAWKLLEAQVALNAEGKCTYVIGTDHPTFLDLYIAIVAHWTPYPRYAWFRENCPRLQQCIEELVKTSDLVKRTFEENHLDGFFGIDSHSAKLDQCP